jgi:predicted RNase H-like HicB family nuclease
MHFPLIVRADSPDHFSAQPLGLPELRTVAKTEAEAIEQASQALVQWLASARFVQVSIPVSSTDNPWLDTFGRSADDPDFDESLKEVTMQQPPAEGDMDEMLTIEEIEEIEARFAPDWVLIAEPQTDDEQRLLAGKVVFHGPDHDEVYRKARELQLDRIAVRYLGTWPEDMVLIL